jgi:hypothetical protein
MVMSPISKGAVTLTPPCAHQWNLGTRYFRLHRAISDRLNDAPTSRSLTIADGTGASRCPVVRQDEDGIVLRDILETVEVDFARRDNVDLDIADQ